MGVAAPCITDPENCRSVWGHSMNVWFFDFPRPWRGGDLHKGGVTLTPPLCKWALMFYLFLPQPRQNSEISSLYLCNLRYINASFGFLESEEMHGLRALDTIRSFFASLFPNAFTDGRTGAWRLTHEPWQWVCQHSQTGLSCLTKGLTISSPTKNTSEKAGNCWTRQCFS